MKINKDKKKYLVLGCLLSVINALLFPFFLSFASGISVSGDGFGRSIGGFIYGFYTAPIIFIFGICLLIFILRSNNKSKLIKVFFGLYLFLLPFMLVVGVLLGLNDPRTPLMRAASKGNNVKVSKLLEREVNNINKEVLFNGQQTDALREAITNNHIDIIEILIHNGANLNNDAHPYIVYASRLGRYKIVKLLIENGAEIGQVAFYEEDALTEASRRGHFKIVELLVKNKAILQSKDKARKAVSTACYYGHNSIVEFLISNGADNSQINMEDCSE